MDALLHIFIVLAVARVLGWAMTRLHQLASVGEILAGVLLAVLIATQPFDQPLLATLPDSPALAWTVEAGIFALLLLTGVELEPREIVGHSCQSLMVAVGGSVLPLLLGFGLGWIALPDSELKQAQCLVIGVGLAISAIPVAAKVFMELGLLHRPVGEIVIAAAVIDDLLGLILLSVLTTLILTGNIPDIGALGAIVLNLALFLGLTSAIGFFLYAPLWRRVGSHLLPGLNLTLLLLIALGFGLLAHALGLHFLLGPFMAGLFFERAQVSDTTYDSVKSVLDGLTFGILAPLFFAGIGLQLDLTAIWSIPGFLALLIAIAFFGKVLGAGLPAYLSGLNRRESLAVGIGMSGRGAVELVILSIAAQAGVFDGAGDSTPIVAHLFSALVITAIVTTLLVPLCLRLVLKTGDRN